MQHTVDQLNLKHSFQVYNDADSEITDSTAISIAMLPSERHPSLSTENDDSEEISHHHSDFLLDDFFLVLRLWVQEAGISATLYTALLEVLSQISNLAQIGNLPKALVTLKLHTKAQLPLMKLRQKKVPLNTAKLSTSNSQAEALGASLFWFDPIDLVKTLLSTSGFMKKVHTGMAEFVDKPSALWHTDSWATSIQSSSGEFAHYSDGSPIFPSDVVYHRCTYSNHGCHTGTAPMHISCVYTVGRDYTEQAAHKGSILIEMQSLVPEQDLIRANTQLSANTSTRDLFLVENRK